MKIVIVIFLLLAGHALAQENQNTNPLPIPNRFDFIIGGEIGKGIVTGANSKNSGEAYSSLFLGVQGTKDKWVRGFGVKQVSHSYESQFTNQEFNHGSFSVSRTALYFGAGYKISDRYKIGGEANVFINGGIYTSPIQEQKILLGPNVSVKVYEREGYFIEGGLSYQLGANVGQDNIHIISGRITIGVDFDGLHKKDNKGK